jgi:hypothetical protein
MEPALKRAAILVGIAVVVLGALAGQALGDPITMSASSGTLTHVTVSSVGLSIGYPSDWLVVQGKDIANGLNKSNKKFAKLNPQIASFITQSSSTIKNAKFFAIDTSRSDPQFANNVNVLLFQGGGFPSSLDDFRSSVAAEFKSISGATLETTSATKVGGHTAYRDTVSLSVTAPDGTASTYVSQQLYAPKGDGAVIVSVATGDNAAGRALAEQMLTSIRPAH